MIITADNISNVRCVLVNGWDAKEVTSINTETGEVEIFSNQYIDDHPVYAKYMARDVVIIHNDEENSLTVAFPEGASISDLDPKAGTVFRYKDSDKAYSRSKKHGGILREFNGDPEVIV